LCAAIQNHRCSAETFWGGSKFWRYGQIGENKGANSALEGTDRETRALTSKLACGSICSTSKAVRCRHLYTFGVFRDGHHPTPLLAEHARNAANRFEVARGPSQHEAKRRNEVTIEIQNAGQSPALFVKIDLVTPEADRPGKGFRCSIGLFR